jgi:hypothetical protein
MSVFVVVDGCWWYRRLVEMFEFTATRQVARDKLDALLAAAADGIGSPPVRIDNEAVLVPAALYDLLVRLVEEHGLGALVQEAVNADYQRQESELRAVAVELGLDPEYVFGRPTIQPTNR